MRGPIAVGGVGGSGTRSVAAVLQALGVFIGGNLNRSLDNLDYPGLERSIGTAPRPFPYITPEEMERFSDLMLRGHERHGGPAWGWKNPPTFMSLEQFASRFPALKYVHVVRHGLDMAYSANRNQVRRWGHLFGIEYTARRAEIASLDYWIRVNDWVTKRVAHLLGERFLVVRFDDFVMEPRTGVERLAAFVGIEADAVQLGDAAASVKPPKSIGRYLRHASAGAFTDRQLEAVRRHGFGIDPALDASPRQ